MKKILAIALTVLLTAALCIGASAAKSLDKVSVNHNQLTEMGNDVVDGELKISAGDKVYILGWALNETTNSRLKEVVYTLDGVDQKCADNYRDRPGLTAAIGVSNSDLDTHAGIGYDDNAFELTGMDKLSEGTYEVTIKAIFEDGTDELLMDEPFKLIVGAGSSSGDKPAGNPNTADASVIAIAAVACIAFAGIVVAKKVK